MEFLAHDMSPVVARARDVGAACRVVIFAPLVCLLVLGTSLREDYLPPDDLSAGVLLTAYACLGIVVWHGWRRWGVDRPTVLAIAAFWAINALLLVACGRSEHCRYGVTFGLFVGLVSVPLLALLVRTACRRERSHPAPVSLRACLGQRRFAERPPLRSTGRRSFWHYLEFSLALLAAIYWTVLVGDFLDEYPSRSSPMLPLIQYGLTIPIFLYAFKCQRLARQCRALSIEEAAGRDRRAPILFLRSFADDAIQVRTAPILTLERMPLECPAVDPKFWGKLIRFEEVLAGALWGIGPVVAIGAPGEDLPQPGAVRSYYDDASWQSEVKALMRHAQLVFVVPSTHKWLRWEIETLFQLGLAAKIVFVLPPGSASTQRERWDIAMGAIAAGGATTSPHGFDPLVRAIVVRDETGLALKSADVNEMTLTLLAKGAAGLALRSG